MELSGRIFPIVILSCLFVVTLIHLGLSIGIIVDFRKYGDIFRPQIGLSAFNLAITFFGLVTAVLGLAANAFGLKILGKIAFVTSAVTGVFALASLITAIVINAKSPDYVNSRVQDAITKYGSDGDAQDKIDMLQDRYSCCGGAIWLDWSNGKLNESMSPMNQTNINMTTTIPTTTTPATTNTTTNTTPPAAPARKRRDIDYVSNALINPNKYAQVMSSRQKRQATNMYGGIYGLPTSVGVALPISCFNLNLMSDNITINGTYILSNANYAMNAFYTQGCSKTLDFAAGNQALGFAVINSFMTVLAFVAMPLLFDSPSNGD